MSTYGEHNMEETVATDAWHIYREYGVMAGAMALIIAVVLAVLLLQQNPVYEADATLLVEPNALHAFEDDTKGNADTLDQRSLDRVLQTHVEQILSRSFLESLLASLTDEERSRIIPPDQSDAAQSAWRERITSSLHVYADRKSHLIRISASHASPESAQFLANHVASHYIEYQLQRAAFSDNSVIQFLEAQADTLRAQVEESEHALQAYRQKNSLVTLDEETNIETHRINMLNQKVTEVDVELMQMNVLLKEIHSTWETGGDLTEIQHITRFGNTGKLKASLDESLSRKAVLEERYLERHPKMIEINRQISSLRQLINESVHQAIAELKNRRDELVKRQQTLTAHRAESEERLLQVGDMTVEANILQRKIFRDRQTYDQILTRLNEMKVSSRLNISNITVLDSAIVPEKPVEPSIPLIGLISLLVFITLWLAIPFLINLVDDRVRGPADIAAALGVPCLATIPSRPDTRDARSATAPFEQDPIFRESMLSLCDHARLLSSVDAPRTLLVAGLAPKEGRSTVAYNLAMQVAEQGRNVIVVDASFRAPRLHEFMHLSNDYGLARWHKEDAKLIQGQSISANIDLEIIKHPRARLSLLRSGGRLPSGGRILQSQAFRQLIGQLAREYDLVVVDSSASEGSDDTLALAACVDQVLVLCKYKQGRAKHLRELIRALDPRGIRVMGIALNHVPKHAVVPLAPSYTGDHARATTMDRALVS